MASRKYTTEQMIDAIKGTGGVKTVIAQRLECHRHTVDNYIERHPTVKRAYEAERETVADFAESVVIGNIRLAFKKQKEDQEVVDSTDAKWFLAMKAKDRGYAERKEITGADGEGVVINLIGVDPDAGD